MSDRGRVDATVPVAVSKAGSLFNAAEVERLLRKEWWINHGHPFPALYGDDGEMQCAACPMDYKRQPIDLLYGHVMVTRARQAEEAMAALASVPAPQATPRKEDSDG